MLKPFQGDPPRSMPVPGEGLQRRIVRGLLRLAALILLVGLPTAAQSPGVSRSMPMPPHPAAPDDGRDFDPRIEAKRMAMLNVIRQKSMITDAEKLLRLARELNDDGAGGGTALSPSDRIHKAAEIEKLAKNVKDKMTYVAGGGPDPNAGFTIQIR